MCVCRIFTGQIRPMVLKIPNTRLRGKLGHLATWHLPGGPVGPPARWATTSNGEGKTECRRGFWLWREGYIG